MSDDVAVLNSAENVSAVTEVPNVTVPEPQSFAEVMQRWTPAERAHWNRTGEEPKPADPVVKVEPVTPPAESEPVAGTGEEDQVESEPDYFGTPEQIARQKHAFAKKSQRIAELKAENKLLREFREERRQRTAEKPAVADTAPETLARPKRPRITDAKYTVENGGSLYDADFDAYETAVDAFQNQQAERRREEQRQHAERQQSGSQWQQELEAARKEDPKFDSIVFSDRFVVSLPMAGVLMSMKGGAAAMKHLALNPTETAELTRLTDIPGNFKSYDELATAAERDPRLARQLGAAEGIVKAAAQRIITGLTKKPDPQPIIVTKAAPPGARVDAAGSPAKDALEEAEAMYDKTGDHKYLVQMNKLADERDREKRRRR